MTAPATAPPPPGAIVSLTARVDQLFPTLTAAQLERFAAHGRTRTVTEGEELTRAGEPTTQLFVVRLGRLDVVRTMAANEEVVASFGPGMFTGEASLLSGRRGVADIRAATPGEVIEVERDRLLTLIQTDSELSEILMRAFILRRVELIARGVGDVVILSDVFSPSAFAPPKPHEETSSAGKCSRCNAPLIAGAKHCIKCGALLTSTSCVSCGTVNPSEARYCKNCGNKI